MNWMDERSRNENNNSILDTRHSKCLGDGIDGCGYDTKIDCMECKYNNAPYGKKDPEAECNNNNNFKNKSI